jgi:hypothetical protein
MSVSQKLNVEVKQELLHKTKLCSFFQQGRCRYGRNCGFAHSQAEIESQPDLSKTSLCLAWIAGTCRQPSGKCRFAHGKHELRVLPDPATPPGLPPAADAVLVPKSLEIPSPFNLPNFEPMKVNSPSIPQSLALLEPLKIITSLTPETLECHWESETTATEANSDDEISLSSTPFSPLCTGSEAFSPSSIFQVSLEDQLQDSDALAWSGMQMHSDFSYDMSSANDIDFYAYSAWTSTPWTS